jgi:hypothetical protein
MFKTSPTNPSQQSSDLPQEEAATPATSNSPSKDNMNSISLADRKDEGVSVSASPLPTVQENLQKIQITTPDLKNEEFKFISPPEPPPCKDSVTFVSIPDLESPPRFPSPPVEIVEEAPSQSPQPHNLIELDDPFPQEPIPLPSTDLIALDIAPSNPPTVLLDLRPPSPLPAASDSVIESSPEMIAPQLQESPPPGEVPLKSTSPLLVDRPPVQVTQSARTVVPANPVAIRGSQTRCSKCGKVKSEGEFSKSQWKKRSGGAKCQVCVIHA